MPCAVRPEAEIAAPSQPQRAEPDTRVRDALAVIAAALLCTVLIEWSGHRQWHLWDLSMVVDSAWRTYLGQRPGVDYISPLPIGFDAIGGVAFRVFGISWSALVHIAAVWACLCLIWEFVLLRALRVSRSWALLISGSICAVTLVQKSFLYHSAFSTPIAAILLTTCFYLLRERASMLALVSLWLASAVLLLGKQNAALSVVLVAALAAVTPRLRVRVIAALVLSAAAAFGIIVLVAGSVSPVWQSTVTAGSMRGLPNTTALFGIYSGLGQTAFWFDIVTVALAFTPLGRRLLSGLTRHEQLLSVGAMMVALYGMSTNNDLKMTDLPPLIVAVFVPIALGGSSRWIVRPQVALGAILALGIAAGMVRLTLSGSAGRVFTSGPLTEMGGDDAFFRGLAAGPRLAAIDRDVTKVAAQIGPRRVFFGPALEFAYAAHGFVPPAGLPLWWHPGTSYALAQSDQIVRRFTEHPPSAAVFILNDWPGMPRGIYQFLLGPDYDRRLVGGLVVFERRSDTLQ